MLPWWGVKSGPGGGSTYSYRLTGADISAASGAVSISYSDRFPGDSQPFRNMAPQTVGVYDITLYLSVAALVLCILAFILSLPAALNITRPRLPAFLHLASFLAALIAALYFTLQLPAAMQGDLNSGRPLHLTDNFIGTLGDTSYGPGISWFLVLVAAAFLLASSVHFFLMGRMKARPHVQYIPDEPVLPVAPQKEPELQVIEIVEEYEYMPPDAPPEFVKAVEESLRKSADKKIEQAKEPERTPEKPADGDKTSGDKEPADDELPPPPED